MRKVLVLRNLMTVVALAVVSLDSLQVTIGFVCLDGFFHCFSLSPAPKWLSVRLSKAMTFYKALFTVSSAPFSPASGAELRA